MPLLSMDQIKLAKLRQVLDKVPEPPLNWRASRAPTARIPTIVRCTSATAAGGSETGHDQCYPAVVVDINSLVATQADGAEVWLTLMDTGTGTVQTPVSGKVYYGLFAGNFDPFPGGGSSDSRPRVFAAAGAAATSGITSGSWSPSVTIVADNTWTFEAGGGVSLGAGDYIFNANLFVHGQLSADVGGTFGTYSSISCRLADSGGTAISSAYNGCHVTVPERYNNNQLGFSQRISLAGTTTVKLQAVRTVPYDFANGQTWQVSSVTATVATNWTSRIDWHKV